MVSFHTVMLFCVAIHLIVLTGDSVPRNFLKDQPRVRRGFRSYFYNYLDEIAMATCAAVPSSAPGLIYAVRRNCSGSSHCKQICEDPALRQQAPKEVRNLTWTCTEFLHVYKRQPTLQDNYDEYVDSRKLGLAVYRHNSCTVAACGPNYCCCKAFQS